MQRIAKSLACILAAFQLASCGSSDSSIDTNNAKTTDLLRKLDWDTSISDTVKEEPVGGIQTLLEDSRFTGPVHQINTLAIFADWFYQCLPEGSDTRHFLDYFIASAYQSENFIWNQRGLLPLGYEVGLPVVRGSTDYLPAVSSWATDSQRGRQFPVLNSSAADAVIGLVMNEFSRDSCALGFGQWQQSHVSGSILSLPWSVPVNTDQNPVLFKDIPLADGNIRIENPNRHKLVLGPITWLSMGLDVRVWHNEPDQARFATAVSRGKKIWQKVHENVAVNHALCSEFQSEAGKGGFFRTEIDELVNAFMKVLCERPASCATEPEWRLVVGAAARAIETVACNIPGHNWDHMTYDRGVAALADAQNALSNTSGPGGGPDLASIGNAATAVQKFYFGENFAQRPFLDPPVAPLLPPATTIPAP
ncbi:MAG: hypothetical protein P8K76_13530 [Candidatus Binatia bacterium]|nr:hypothetical protein [Candidatus Binatia bacterium]MDG2010790.1 hypothetical protein [Candidatus Binatia bacterium]